MIILILSSKLNDMTIEIRNFISATGYLQTIQSYLNDLELISDTTKLSGLNQSQSKLEGINSSNSLLKQESRFTGSEIIDQESSKEYAISVNNLEVTYPGTKIKVIQNMNFKI